MIPLKDNIPSSRRPVVNYFFIGACALVFLLQLADERDGRADLIYRYGMIPARVRDPERQILVQELVRVETRRGDVLRREARPIAPPPFTPWLTLLTCIFLHGGWLHFLGNVWFLFIFGDNVEDRFGRLGYLLFYLGWGVAASAAHLLVSPGSEVPTIGASGAIAGVMGAYFLLYPRAMVLALVPIIIYFEILVLPAFLFLGFWFLLQILPGLMSLGPLGSGGGVAWWAHIGGFVAGFATTLLLRRAGIIKEPVRERLPRTDRWTHYRYRRGGW